MIASPTPIVSVPSASVHTRADLVRLRELVTAAGMTCTQAWFRVNQIDREGPTAYTRHAERLHKRVLLRARRTALVAEVALVDAEIAFEAAAAAAVAEREVGRGE